MNFVLWINPFQPFWQVCWMGEGITTLARSLHFNLNLNEQVTLPPLASSFAAKTPFPAFPFFATV